MTSRTRFWSRTTRKTPLPINPRVWSEPKTCTFKPEASCSQHYIKYKVTPPPLFLKNSMKLIFKTLSDLTFCSEQPHSGDLSGLIANSHCQT